MRNDMTAATADLLDDLADDVRRGSLHQDDAHAEAERVLGRELSDTESDAMWSRLNDARPRDMSAAEELAAARADAIYDTRGDR